MFTIDLSIDWGQNSGTIGEVCPVLVELQVKNDHAWLFLETAWSTITPPKN